MPLRQDSDAPPMQDHRPAVLLRVGEAGEGVDDAGAGHDEAGAGAAGQVADGLRGVRGGLLVAHPDVRDAFLLRGGGDRAHRKARRSRTCTRRPAVLRLLATRVAPSTSAMSSLLSEWGFQGLLRTIQRQVACRQPGSKPLLPGLERASPGVEGCKKDGGYANAT